MAKLSLLGGTVSKTVKVFVQDSSSATGAGLTGLLFNTASLSAYYVREGAGAAVAITLVTATLGTWTSSGFVVVSAAHMPGLYELGIPDAALAAGVKSVTLYLFGATNMAPVLLEIELTAVDNQDAVRYGMTSLPNAAANAAGGLVISAAGALDMDDLAADVDATETRVVLALPAFAPQAAGGLITSTAGALDLDEMNVDIEAIETRTTLALPSAAPQAAGGLITSTAGSFDIDEMNVDVEAIQAKTDGLTFTVANQVDVNVKDWNGSAVTDLVNPILDSGTAQAGAASTITLASSANATDSFYLYALIQTSEGGVNQARTITGYVGATRVATVDRAWVQNPTNATAYAIFTADEPPLSVSGAVTTSYYLKKNTAAAAFEFVMTSSTTGAPTPALTVTAQRSIDGAAFAACANAVAEVGSGVYKISLAAADLNGNIITLRFTAVGANDSLITLVLQA